MKLIDYFVPAVATLSLPIFYLIIYFQSGECKWSALKALLDRVKASWTTGGGLKCLGNDGKEPRGGVWGQARVL